MQEVHHVAVHHPVVYVANGATEDQYDGDGGPGFMGFEFSQPAHQHHADHNSQGHEEPALPAGGIRQEAERRAGVVQQGQVEAGQHRYRVTVGEHGGGHGLGAQVDGDHHYYQPQPLQFAACPALSHYCVRQAEARVSPGPSTLVTQRPHRSLCCSFWPTSSRWCQQRSHLAWEAGVTFTSRPSTLVCSTPAASLTGFTVASEVISTKRSSSPRWFRRSARLPSQYRVTSALKEPLISPRARASSRHLFTASFTA